MAHSPRQEGANPAPGSRHKRKFEGVAASAGWRGRLARAWAAEERRHRVAGQQPSLHDAKVVAQFRSTIWRPPNDNHHGPNPIARLRCLEWPIGPYPGLIEMAAAIEGQPGHPRHSKDG